MLHGGVPQLCLLLLPEFRRHARAQLGRVRGQMGVSEPASGPATAAPATTRGEGARKRTDLSVKHCNNPRSAL